jgi:hypothetical protein
MADQAIGRFGGPEIASVQFKFSCKWCGTRCTLDDYNRLYENGECWQCGKLTEIASGGFALIMRFGGKEIREQTKNPK